MLEYEAFFFLQLMVTKDSKVVENMTKCKQRKTNHGLDIVN